MPKRKITANTVSRAEDEHVGWMSDIKYYNQVLQQIVADLGDKVLVGPPLLVRNNKHKGAVKNVNLKIIKISEFGKYAQTQAQIFKSMNHTVFVWTIGNLYATNANVHWNVFLYESKSKTMLQFDPGLCTTGRCYVYSKSIATKIASAFKISIEHVKLDAACQADLSGSDHFCQTWVLLFTDYFIHNKQHNKLKMFQEFDFLNNGKALLKTWLQCIYKNLMYGDETWFRYANKKFPGLFHYHNKRAKLVRAPSSKVSLCWKTITAG